MHEVCALLPRARCLLSVVTTTAVIPLLSRLPIPISGLQVMWNTKLLARGRKVNREFAFISFLQPEAAGHAIHWMHNAYIEGLSKDKDGLTVQYESQGCKSHRMN